MDRRAAARAVLLAVVSVGVVAGALSLGRGGEPPGHRDGDADGGRATAAVALSGSVQAPRVDAQAVLEQTRGGVPMVLAAVDESRPHRHLVDPRTGGLVSVAGAVGTVTHPEALGPVHTDPMPPGVSLAGPVDTGALLARADLGLPGTATGDAPPGTPGIPTLSEHVLPSCSGTGADGNRVQALYVREAGTPSRFAQVLPILRNEIANVDDVFALSARQTGGDRRVRWVHDAACRPVVREVTVPDGALGPDFWGTISAVQALGYRAADRKYLMFTDANRLCGVGTVYDDTRLTRNANDGTNASYARIDAACWSSGHSVAAHELTHNLGAVQRDAPHATPNGHCSDEADLMCYADGPGVVVHQVCASAQEQLLDCNHDDYFHTDPPAGTYLAASWNTASSSFLDAVVSRPAPAVTVRASVTAAETGDPVVLTATSSRPVAWAWRTSSVGAACSLATGAAGRATLLCPSSVTGSVVVTATGTEVGTGATGVGAVGVALSRAAAPTAVLTAPPAVAAGTSFQVGVSPTGKAPFTFAWQAGGCAVGRPASASSTVTCPIGTTAGDLALSVRVTQADGQSVRPATTVGLTGAGPVPPPGTPVPAPTSWTTPALRSGTMTARLRQATDAAPAGATVRLQVRWAGSSPWRNLELLRTDATGRVSATPVHPRAGWFRFAAVADPTRQPSVSREVYVKVQTRLTVSAPTRRRVAGVLQTASGARVPGATVLLQRRAAGTSRWVTVARPATDSRGVVARAVRPVRTTYFRWVYAGEAVHLGARSPSVRLR